MINYDSICKKVGFDPMTSNRVNECSDYEDDSKPSPYSVLNLEELNFLIDYLKKNKYNMV